ncbi:MAG: protein kinase, partial [Planctomycetota bacterium]|nr:protein kinase [Planctomycetota bacterium]
MDFNRLQGQYLVSRGIVSVETVQGALQLMATQPARDLLECLTRQGLLDPTQAQGIRNEIQLQQSNAAFNPGSGLHPSYHGMQANALNQGSGAHPGVQQGPQNHYHPGSGLHPNFQQVQQGHLDPTASSSSVIRTISQGANPILAGSGQIPVQQFQRPLHSPGSSAYNPALNQSSGMSSQSPREYISHYKIEREIGRGGMGAVYTAYCSKLKREVAIKTVTLDGVDASTALERFRREASAMARLSHPNIVTVLDFGEDNGVHFLVM